MLEHILFNNNVSEILHEAGNLFPSSFNYTFKFHIPPPPHRGTIHKHFITLRMEAKGLRIIGEGGKGYGFSIAQLQVTLQPD